MQVKTLTITTTPQLVFSGCGRLVLSAGGSVRLGGADFDPGDPATFAVGAVVNREYHFSAPVEIYAATGAGTDSLSLVHWF